MLCFLIKDLSAYFLHENIWAIVCIVHIAYIFLSRKHAHASSFFLDNDPKCSVVGNSPSVS